MGFTPILFAFSPPNNLYLNRQMSYFFTYFVDSLSVRIFKK